MFGRTRQSISTKIDPVMDRILEEMIMCGPDEDKYSDYLEYLERVAALRTKSKKSVSPDQVLLVAGNLFGILVIVAYEQKHVMASKGLGFILKSK